MQRDDMPYKLEVPRVKAFGPGLCTITVNELTCFTVESFDVNPGEIEITIDQVKLRIISKRKKRGNL